MKWITEITLNNFRGFGNPETIIIPKGNHLLIYGENGSGKSSIYHALKDLFASSVPVPDPRNKITFKVNKFQELAGNDKGNITIKISEVDNANAPDEYKFNSSETPSTTVSQPGLILANKYRGFLDYKKMLKVHALEIPDGETPNIFSLLMYDLLSEHKILDPKGGTTSIELLPEYTRIKKGLAESPPDFGYKNLAEVEDKIIKINMEIEELEIEGDRDSLGQISELQQEEEVAASFRDKFKLLNELDELSKSLYNKERKEGLLRKVFRKANVYLRAYFKNKIKVDILFTGLNFLESEKNIEENIGLKVYYAGKELEYYHTFLNEARLSSLAICLYLASIKIFETEPDTLKVLYLDDIFIGLDTSNRFPLLEIIKKEFINEGFQVFISTYDKQWFDLSRHWFETKIGAGNIQSIELYIDDAGNINNPDNPIIIPFKGNLKKARAYFKCKDYPAAGNYIRKECEVIIKGLLPSTYKINNEGKLIDDLEGLMQQLDRLYDDCNIQQPTDLIDSIKIYRKSLLNPSSHDDTKSSLFKKELEDAFEIAKKLQSLTPIVRTQVAEKGRIFTYENVANNYLAELELADNVWKITQSTGNSFSKFRFYVTKWTWNTDDYAVDGEGKGNVMKEPQKISFCEKKRSLDEIFDIIIRNLKIVKPANLLLEIKIGTTGTLNDLLQ